MWNYEWPTDDLPKIVRNKEGRLFIAELHPKMNMWYGFGVNQKIGYRLVVKPEEFDGWKEIS